MENSEAYEWLAELYETDVNGITEALKDEKASLFLIVWSIFEQRLFKGFFQKKKIQDYANNHIQKIDIEKLEKIIKYFYERYQDEKKYKNLRHDDSCPAVEEILKKTYCSLNDEEKFVLLLYVIYRYRNNIFHGNKGVMSWNQYKEQIEYCLDAMIIILDSFKNQSADREEATGVGWR